MAMGRLSNRRGGARPSSQGRRMKLRRSYFKENPDADDRFAT
jgi:hypothetical protein